LADAFYGVYREIRRDLLEGLSASTHATQMSLSTEQQLGAVQLLLDRMLFLHLCEDHPDQLLREHLVRDTVAEAAQKGSEGFEIYRALKAVFRGVAKGAHAGLNHPIADYAGDLFAFDEVVDVIDLPDDLSKKLYRAKLDDSQIREVEGVWGLHAFDYWGELDERLLGSILERSLSDVVELLAGRRLPEEARRAARKRHGVFYTQEILSGFVSERAIRSQLGLEVGPAHDGSAAAAEARVEALLGLKVLDLSCGAGAFLNSAYRELARAALAVNKSLERLERENQAARQLVLALAPDPVTRSSLLDNCLHGVDLSDRAVATARLSLRLRALRKGVAVPSLNEKLIVGDGLRFPEVLERVGGRPAAFDLVLGNPPWGGEVLPESYAMACDYLDVDAGADWDSWELFVLLGLAALRPGGRLALVLPDTLLSPAKARTRRILLRETTIETMDNLGPDWFGPKVRMSSLLLQCRKGAPARASEFTSMVLGGESRRLAQGGNIGLRELEARSSRTIPQRRCRESENYEIELTRSARDDELLERMMSRSDPMGSACDHFRGEEVNKAGLLWTCSACQAITTPGRKGKQGAYHAKLCPKCARPLNSGAARESFLVYEGPARKEGDPLFVTGDDMNARYASCPAPRRLDTALTGFGRKSSKLYAGDKVLIRQAGVGISAMLVGDAVRCPQSVYGYRFKAEQLAAGYANEFLLAVLNSRTLNFYFMKRFGDSDPAKAFVKVTHTRLAAFPIPKVDFSDPEQEEIHREIVKRVCRLAKIEDPNGCPQDFEVERLLWQLWGLDEADGAHMNAEFAQIPPSQTLKLLFPGGVPQLTS
jgi:hypothetical protein